MVLHNNNKIVRFLHRDHRENNRVEVRNNCETKGNMGGNKKRFEPASCSDWKKKNEFWEILQEGGLSVFIERLYGKDPTVTKHFIKNWNNGKVLVGTQMKKVDEDVIAEAMCMVKEGIKFYKDRSVSNKATDRFPITDGEKRKLVKVDNPYHSPKCICKPWRFVLFATISYITLDERFTRACGHHFVLLNHFYYGDKVSLPYYLACSMDHTIREV